METVCGHEPYLAKGLCQNCYATARRRAAGVQPRPTRAPACPHEPKHAMGYCLACYQTNHRRKNGAHLAVLKRAWRYGLSEEGAHALLSAGVCSICGRAGLTGKNAHIDHDHATGKVRGLLCLRCNMLVGQIEASDLQRADLFVAIEAYLGAN